MLAAGDRLSRLVERDELETPAPRASFEHAQQRAVGPGGDAPR
jgi:hypothetical protein